MKKRAKKRRKTKSRRKRNWLMKPSKSTSEVYLEIEGLEVAKGFDGFLRGSPEPVLVCGVFAISESKSQLLGRGIARFPNPRTFPTTVKLSDSMFVRAASPLAKYHQFAVVLLGLEEDGGADIQRAYTMLQAHTELFLLETSGDCIAVEVGDMTLDVAHWSVPRRVDLVVDNEHFDQACSSDKWISASGFVVQRGEQSRVHFLSSDGKNDWTAVVAFR